MLIGVLDQPGITSKLILKAIEKRPSVIIDAANKANPHAFFHVISQEDLTEVYLMEVELIYKFRDILKRLRTKKPIFITAFDGLFNYQDTLENTNIFHHAWLHMKRLSKNTDVTVVVTRKQEAFAKKYCDVILSDLKTKSDSSKVKQVRMSPFGRGMSTSKNSFY